MKIRKINRFLAVLLVSVFVVSCGGKTKKDKLSADKVVVGVTGGNHQQIMEKVKELAKDRGINIELKVFSDYSTPNAALSEGSLDMNVFQTKPFLDEQIKYKKYEIATAFETFSEPMAIYSKKIRSFDELKEADQVAVPNDPSNELRALRLYEVAGLIKLKDGLTEGATIKDIVENKKNLKFVELPAEQLPAQLQSITLASINGNYALNAGLEYDKEGLFKESSADKYINFAVVRTELVNDSLVSVIKELYQSEPIREYINNTFKGSVNPAF